MLGKGFEIPLTEFRKKGEIMKQPHTFGIREVEKSRNTAVTQQTSDMVVFARTLSRGDIANETG